MKTLPPALAAHLAGGVTTLARCWLIQRRDGVSLGFTDHDVDLDFDGVTFHADSGFTASALESQPGLAVSNVDLEGALRSDAITEADLAAGRYDDAECRLYLVNWQDAGQRVLLRRGHIGEVTRGRSGYSAELRGLAHRLDQPAGRLFERRCAWTLGDARCGIDLAAPAFRAAVTVAAVEGRLGLRVGGIDDAADGTYSHGRLSFTAGVNAGLAIEVAEQRGARLRLLLPLPGMPAVGDAGVLTAGCDRRFATCGARFGNAVNFGGFPHMPGADFVLSYPNQGDGNDGASLA
ncbi:DUF2163 domain-containing protein [Zavarzinia compransoris]|uniref:Beta tubulin n=1 Tax=Zavarzinia compransoris TaxID=1264899 RepID=A0A317DXP3_9PROT|nr:DUF2163 domain-containing protein [Zavarzinia compransoris]PWR19154.1 beta tubulin [Zavarzinia compransoris]TDP49168.1 putative phage protein (TIGR02218 family) [Zavarzinia compransoris]